MATKQRSSRPSSTKKPAKKAAARAGQRSSAPARPVARVEKRKKPAPRAAAARPAAKPTPRVARPARIADKRPPAVSARPAPIQPPQVVAVPSGPSSHDVAVEVFERGFRALQQRSYPEAAGLFASIIEAHPDEKELHERARVYLAVCSRHAPENRRQEPKTVEERMNAATVAINQAAFGEALQLLRSVERDDGENDLVQYMLAIAHASLGQADDALEHLRQAVALNPENRYLAVQDGDLESLRQHPAFVALLEPPASRRQAPTQVRSSR